MCVCIIKVSQREREREIPIQAINMNNNKISFCKVHDKWDNNNICKEDEKYVCFWSIYENTIFTSA